MEVYVWNNDEIIQYSARDINLQPLDPRNNFQFIITADDLTSFLLNSNIFQLRYYILKYSGER